jgi:hypothetical protein
MKLTPTPFFVSTIKEKRLPVATGYYKLFWTGDVIYQLQKKNST